MLDSTDSILIFIMIFGGTFVLGSIMYALQANTVQNQMKKTQTYEVNENYTKKDITNVELLKETVENKEYVMGVDFAKEPEKTLDEVKSITRNE